jgi:hypothetical protein
LPDATFERWLTALEARHTANLQFKELTPALRALSSAYVERRTPNIARSTAPASARLLRSTTAPSTF